MSQRVVLLLYYGLVYLPLYSVLTEDPVDIILQPFLGGHTVTTLPVGCCTEVYVVINQALSLLQGYPFTPTNNL